MNGLTGENRHSVSKVIYAVYTQFDPTYKYDEQLHSLWTTEESAKNQAKIIKGQGIYDVVWVTKLQLDSEELYGN
jgi:hypothetical protein